MSYHNTVILSFSNGEWDEETMWPPKAFKPLKKINKWLSKHDFEPLVNLGKKGDLGSNAVLFGGTYNHLDVEAFCEVIEAIKWRDLDDVQMLYWSDQDSKFSVITFPLPP